MTGSLAGYARFLVRYLGPLWLGALLLAILLFGEVGLKLIIPQIVRYFIDTARAGGDVTAMGLVALLFLGVAVLTQAVSVAEGYVADSVGWRATNALRADLLGQCLELDLSFHHAHPPGELIERVDGDVATLANFFSRFVLRVLGNAVMLVGVLFLLFREDWRLGAVLLAFSLVALALLTLARGIGARYAQLSRQASAELFSFLEERLSGLGDIQSSGARGYVMDQWVGLLRQLIQRARTSTLVGAALPGPAYLLVGLGSVVAFAIAASLYQAGTLSLGTVYLVFQYTAMLRDPLSQLARQSQDFQGASASIARIQQLFEAPRTIKDGPGGALPSGALPVEFRDVTFRYSAGVPVLRGITFHVDPEHVLGVLGRTGSGKTTLTRLLLRLYDTTVGVVQVGGVDVRQAGLADLRQRIGVVTQDVQLFRATLRDNLTLFDRAISDDRVLQALTELGLLGWCRSLPAGLDTDIGSGGVGLSAGESQLVAFARVFLKDPGVVILDEASSRLDPATERLIENAIDRLLRGRTGIVVAHRLETVRRVDEILILDDGKVVEHDRRERLIADPGSGFSRLLRTGLAEVIA